MLLFLFSVLLKDYNRKVNKVQINIPSDWISKALLMVL
jgi:hypothetical protein